jgi:DNA-binding Xre family transcriptional regulator
MNYKKIHLGKLIQSFVKENNINSADLARKVGKSRQNIYDLYKRDDIEVKLFLAISEALQHNFIEELSFANNKNTDLDTVFDTLKLLVKEKLG